jgi:hypothetical protein
MSYVVFASPLHILPQQIDMPRLQDDLGGGAVGLRRRFTRPLSSWQLEIPGKQELLDPILGLLEYVQGDVPIWFDGAGFGEETSPIVVGIGDSSTQTDYMLPHRHVFIASLIVYVNGSEFSNWMPLGGDGVVCDSIRLGTSLGLNNQLTAKYRRRIKCLVRVDDKITRQRVFRSQSFNADNLHNLTVTLEESIT